MQGQTGPSYVTALIYVNCYSHSSTVFGPRRERKKIYLVTRRSRVKKGLMAVGK
jgi:hypothetical protein